MVLLCLASIFGLALLATPAPSPQAIAIRARVSK